MIGLIAPLIAVALALLPARPAAARDQVDVRVSVPLAASHPAVAGGWRAFTQVAGRQGQGSLRFRLFVDDALASPLGTAQALADGSADMGFVAPADDPAAFPHLAFLAHLAMLDENGVAAAAALTELIMVACAPCRAEFAAKGLVFLGTYASAPYVLLLRAPLASPRPLAGFAVWAPGSLWDRWLRSVGATPVHGDEPAPDALLRSGKVSAAIALAATVTQQRLWPATPVVINLPLGTYLGASPFTASRAFWETLGKEQRATLLAAAPAGMVATMLAYRRQEREMLAEAAEHGVKLVPPDATLKASVAPFVQAERAEAGRRGEARFALAKADDLAAAYQALYAKYADMLGARADEASANPRDNAVAILRRVLFAKVDPGRYGLEPAPGGTDRAEQPER